MTRETNTWEVVAARPMTMSVFDCPVDAPRNMDRKTRNLMTIDNALYPKIYINVMYRIRKEA